jgi:hypothetical protein
MLNAIMVEHFIHVESNPPPCRVVHECRYRSSGRLLTVRSHAGPGADRITATFFMVLGISAPFNSRASVRADGVEFLIQLFLVIFFESAAVHDLVHVIDRC